MAKRGKTPTPSSSIFNEIESWISQKTESRPSREPGIQNSLSKEKLLTLGEAEEVLLCSRREKERTLRMRKEAEELRRKADVLEIEADARDKLTSRLEAHAWELAELLLR